MSNYIPDPFQLLRLPRLQLENEPRPRSPFISAGPSRGAVAGTGTTPLTPGASDVWLGGSARSKAQLGVGVGVGVGVEAPGGCVLQLRLEQLQLCHLRSDEGRPRPADPAGPGPRAVHTMNSRTHTMTPFTRLALGSTR
jgi:hypothetical protein